MVLGERTGSSGFDSVMLSRMEQLREKGNGTAKGVETNTLGGFVCEQMEILRAFRIEVASMHTDCSSYGE